MPFLDKTGLARLWQNISALAESKVPKTRTVNGKSLIQDITLNASDVNADVSGAANTALTAAKAYTDTKVSNLPTTNSITSSITVHNNNQDAHPKIQELIAALDERLDALDEGLNLEAIQEVINLIKENEDVLGALENAVFISDIVDNLTSNNAQAPLSANQGRVLKDLIDTIDIPTKVSELINDSNYLIEIPLEYITETELNNKNYLTQSSLSDYATQSWTGANFQPKGNYAPAGDYANRNDIVDPLIGSTSTISPQQVAEAMAEGRPIALTHQDENFGGLTVNYFVMATDQSTLMTSGTINVSGSWIAYEMFGNLSNNTWDSVFTPLVKQEDLTNHTSVHAPSNAQPNQNAFSNITVGSTTVAADTTTDTVTFAGSNVTITPDATSDKITFGITKTNVTTALGYTPVQMSAYVTDNGAGAVIFSHLAR